MQMVSSSCHSILESGEGQGPMRVWGEEEEEEEEEEENAGWQAVVTVWSGLASPVVGTRREVQLDARRR